VSAVRRVQRPDGVRRFSNPGTIGDMGRALGARRLSRKTDESTSMERQGEQIELTARIRGDSLVCMTEDTDVSGSISPFEREDLGPWLTDPDKISQWDVLIVAKLDRLTRSLKHFDDIISWLDRNGKTLVSVSESLDLSTNTGRMFANLLAMFAQFERERIGERRREAGVTLRENGWWQGGQAPYGYKPLKVDNHWILQVDTDARVIVERMAAGVISGKSRRAIGRELTADGIPTPAGGKEWGERTITKILTSEYVVLDPITRYQVLEALDKTKVSWTRRGDAAMLLNIASCPCGQLLYARRWQHKQSGKVYEYYGCAVKCGQRNIRMDVLESVVGEMMLEAYGDLELATEEVTPGYSHKAAITAIERKIHALDMDAEDYNEIHAELMAERKRLKRTNESQPDKAEPIRTGQTLAKWWPSARRAVKRELMLANGISLTASMGDDGMPVVSFGEFLLSGVTREGLLILPPAAA
jgi:site-specific DNA recombinase